ncbi:hypothetical protein F2P56_023763 [Juglans regia]|uniref:Uncharacterized protein n=1 Tax=Juglans regia TaxID=51240 RepID=A0A833TRD7_JUGRE|nr:hypothetical protein F2P56_023763 [Juglans regia]
MLVLMLLRGGKLFPELVRQIQCALHLPGRSGDAIAHVFRFLGFSENVQEFLDRDVDFADLFIPQAPIGLDLDDEGEAVLLCGGVVDSELDREVPFRACPTIFVGGCLVLRGFEVVVAVDLDDGVDVHLGEKIDILQVLRGLDYKIQSPTLHNWKKKMKRKFKDFYVWKFGLDL